MIWKILDIEETKDKRAITRAYREKLSVTNPEEQPERFQELRAAYEKALLLADETEKPMEEKTEAELWSEKLAEVYFDLKKRLDINAWKALLANDFCQALDTRGDAEALLLDFMGDHFHIPHEIMLYLEEQFGFMDHLEELRETRPADFLEYVIISGIRNEDSFPLDMFTPGLDGKAADYYMQICRQIQSAAEEEAEPLYQELINSREKHPFGESMLIRKDLAAVNAALEETEETGGDQKAAVPKAQTGELTARQEELLCALKKLWEAWPENDHLAMDLMFACRDAGRISEAEEIAKPLAEHNPELLAARQFLAEAAAGRGEYREAISMITRLLQEVIGDTRSYRILMEQRNTWNEAFIEQQKDKVAADPSDIEGLFDLIWSYLELDRYAEADELAKELPKEKPDAFKYYNVKAALARNCNRCEEAISHLEKLLAVIDALEPDGTKETEERIGRRPEVVCRIASALYDLGRPEEAVSMAEEVLGQRDDDPQLLFMLMSMHRNLGNYQRCAEVAELLLANDPGNAGALHFKAYANYRLGRDNAAFQAINDAIEAEGSELSHYLLKLLILTRNDAFKPANDLIGFLEQNGIEKEPTVEYCKLVMFYETEDENRTKEEYDDMLASAAEIDRALTEDAYDDLAWAAHFYLTYALTTADRQNFDKKYPMEPIFELLEKGLARDPEYYGLLNYKAWLLKKKGDRSEALEIYKRLEERENHSITVERNIAEIYFADLEDQAQEACRYYELLLKQEPDNAAYSYYAGMCRLRMEDLSAAEAHFLNEQRVEPDDIDGYYRLAYVYLKQKRLEEAIEQGKKTLERIIDTDRDTVRFWLPLIRAYERSGRIEEALQTVAGCKEQNPEWSEKKLVFDIYFRAGRYDEAQRYVDTWKKENKDGKHTGWSFPQLKLDIMRDDSSKLKFHLWNYQSLLTPSEKKIVECVQASCSRDPGKYCKVHKDYYRSRAEKEIATYHEKAGYAWACFVEGDLPEARAAAEESLAELELQLQKATGAKLLYQCKKIELLGILGRIDEARAVAAEAKTMPLCETCDYHDCKDLDYFLCQLEFIEGNYEKVTELALYSAEKWPDETDFIEIKHLAKMKGRW